MTQIYAIEPLDSFILIDISIITQVSYTLDIIIQKLILGFFSILIHTDIPKAFDSH